MGDMLSQAEIDALLGGGSLGDTADDSNDTQDIGELDILSPEQKDTLGEIGNISMGTAATTLFALLGKKVLITTPQVSVRKWSELTKSYSRPCVGTRIDYKEGLRGSNILILKESDVKIISNLMMGGDGIVAEDEPLNELDLSAISEAMNQMIGSSSTSLSSLVRRRIDIDTPVTFLLDFNDDKHLDNVGFTKEDIVVCISFRMEIGNLIDSNIMQILPKDFAVEIVDSLMSELIGEAQPAPKPASIPAPETYTRPEPQPAPQPEPTPQPQPAPQSTYAQPPHAYSQPQPPPYAYTQPSPPPAQQNINVSPVQFQNFDAAATMQQKENIGLIMDVPLEVTVELGRTRKKIKDILEFAPGTIVELDKLAGDPVDILVNGKFVARGEVVAIDENFGVRISDIISVENRI